MCEWGKYSSVVQRWVELGLKASKYNIKYCGYIKITKNRISYTY